MQEIERRQNEENLQYKENSAQHNQDNLQPYMSQIIINDISDDSAQTLKTHPYDDSESDLDTLYVKHHLDKTEFINSEAFANFSEMLVVAQIRSDLSNMDPFMVYISTMERAIKKAVRKTTIQNRQCENKEQFETIHPTMFRVYYQDINVGFITSTGQLKATSYFYLNNSVVEQLNQQQLHLRFKKQQLKITTFFQCKDAFERSQNLFMIKSHSQNQAQISLSSFANILKEEKNNNNTQTNTTQHSNNLSIPLTSISSRKSDNDSVGSQLLIQNAITRKNLPCQNMWIKSAFIRTDKFRTEYIQIQKPQDEELKSGISIHFVYRPMDDQIYAIKKSCLNSQTLSFYDVFSTMYLQDMTQDHRKIREAKILSKLNHPNVLRLYDWWVEEEFSGSYALYMQLEYCSFPGFNHQTNDLLNFSYYYLNPMSNEVKVEHIKLIMKQIVDGLEYIHSRGIVHRDLKPENIFVSITTQGELQVMLADFDQGKDVRELKLSIITDEKISEFELNSIKSRNTIQSGTSGYQTPNSNKNRPYGQQDEFYALGVTLLHLILTFPGEPKNRNHYATTFVMSDIEDVLMLFDIWSNKFVKNKYKTFTFETFTPQLQLAKDLIDKKIQTHDAIRKIIQSW